MGETRYVQNPGAYLREEDEYGALLCSRGTNQVLMLNSTGLFIWKFCAGSRARDEISAALRAGFEGVPDDQDVMTAVDEYLSQMVASGLLSRWRT
jgi:hypothetical protein